MYFSMTLMFLNEALLLPAITDEEAPEMLLLF